MAACGGSSSSGSSSGSSGGSQSSSPNNANCAASASLGTVLYGTLPPTGTPVKAGGVITQGQLTGQTPTYIFPIVPGANTTTGTISLLTSLFMPLYGGPTGAGIPVIDYALSAASALPVASDGGKTFTVPLKQGLKWSNGAPITANDFLFCECTTC